MRYLKITSWKLASASRLFQWYGEPSVAVEGIADCLIDKYQSYRSEHPRFTKDSLAKLNQELSELVIKLQKRNLLPSDITIGDPPDLENFPETKIMKKIFI